MLAYLEPLDALANIVGEVGFTVLAVIYDIDADRARWRQAFAIVPPASAHQFSGAQWDNILVSSDAISVLEPGALLTFALGLISISLQRRREKP